MKKNFFEKSAKNAVFAVLLIASFIAFVQPRTWLKWSALFLTVFSWRYLYREFSGKMQKKWLAENLFSVSSLTLLSLMLYPTWSSYLLADLFSGNLAGSIVFCSALVLVVSAVRLCLFPKALPRHKLEKRELSRAVFSNALSAINEEAWFRGAILFFLLTALNTFMGVILCALLFSLMHLKNRKILIWSFFNGLVFSTAVVLFGNIAGPIWGHFLLNILNRYSNPFK